MKKKPFLLAVICLTVFSLIFTQIAPLIYKNSKAGDNFLANWNNGSLNAFVGNGDTTASTDTVLPDLVDGGFGGSGQAIQASRGDTLKYSTASNFDNNKVEYSMQLKNKYTLTGVDQSKFKASMDWYNIFSVAYDQAHQTYFLSDKVNQRIIKMNWSGTIWENILDGMFSTSLGKIIYDNTNGHLYVIDGNCVIKTKENGSEWTKLCGFNNPKGLAIDSTSGFLYVANTNTNSIIKTKIDGTGWASFGSYGSSVNQFNYPIDLDYSAAADCLYVSDGANHRVIKTKFDGTDWTELTIAGQTATWGSIQYDPTSDYIFINTKDDSNGGSIYRTKIDGTGQIIVGAPGYYTFDFYYDPVTDYLFWFNGGHEESVRIHSDGSGRELGQLVGGMTNGIAGPMAVWVDNGNIYANSTLNSIFKVADNGSNFKLIGSSGLGSGQFMFQRWGRSIGLTYDNSTGDIYAFDNGKYSSLIQTNESLSKWNSLAGFWVYHPNDVSYDAASSYLYITDADNNRIVKSKMDGTDRTNWGSAGSGVGQFSYPSGIWYDPDSDFLYIMDKGNNRLVKTKFNDSSEWTVLPGFSSPLGMSFDVATEYFYIADTGSNRIIKTKIDGTGWTVLGGFSSPSDVFYDSATDYIYVADTSNNRIVKTKMDGTGWTNMTLDPRRVLFKTQGDEMRLELDLYSQRLKFWMKKATGGIFLQSEPLNWGVDEWHKPAVYFNRATGKVELKIDDVVVDSAEDPTWTTALPSFGNYVYVSTDPANPDAVNVSPMDDFKVEVETVDVADPANPAAIHAYDSNQKTVEFQNNAWGNSASPYFEFSGAQDDSSGVLGYSVYFGTAIDGEPMTSGIYQAHNGQAGAIQTFASNTNLVSGTTYYLRIRTRDNDYNYSEPSTLFVYKYDGGPPSAPEYINVSPQGCSTSSKFSFSWPKVPDEVSGLAGYDYKNGSNGNISPIEGLNLNDENYNFDANSYQEGDNILYIRARDNAGNVSQWQTAVYCSTGTAHVIDGPTVVAGPSSISVNWGSSKQTTSYVQVYDGNTYISEQGQTNYSMTHSVKVVGLDPEKQYRYKLVWTDQSGNLGESIWYDTTTATTPRILDLRAEIVSPSRAIVSWKTNYQSTASVKYGLVDYANQVTFDSASDSFVQQLEGLAGGSNYKIGVDAITIDGSKYSAGLSLTTPPLPSISGLKFDPITDQAAPAIRVTWDSNVDTTSTLFYGVKGQESKQELSKSEKTRSHELLIANLVDNTDYEVYTTGIDQWGNVAKSDTNVFKTALDTRAPKIENISTETSNIGSGKKDFAQVTVAFKTDEAAKCFIEFGEGISAESYSNKTNPDEIYSTNHISSIDNLSPQSPYHFRVQCVDQASNSIQSSDQTVISGEITASVFNIVISTLINLFGWVEKIM